VDARLHVQADHQKRQLVCSEVELALARGDRDDAKTLAEKLHRVDDSTTDELLLRGELLRTRGQLARAHEVLDKAKDRAQRLEGRPPGTRSTSRSSLALVERGAAGRATETLGKLDRVLVREEPLRAAAPVAREGDARSARPMMLGEYEVVRLIARGGMVPRSTRSATP